MLRIISGSAKGRKLQVPSGTKIRPTSDKVRESLFNIIGRDNIVGSTFLDLFAGSGAVGIEAISRGAACATLIDNHVKHIRVLKENIRICGFQQSCEVIFGDSITIIDRLTLGERSYDILFADPPYNYNNWSDLLLKIIKNVRIAGYGFLICEHSSKVSMPNLLIDFEDDGKYVYGDSTLTVYRKHGNNSDISRDI